MKPTNLRSGLTPLCALALALAPIANAAQLIWDNNGATAPNPSDGGGTWNTALANWWNGSANVTWNNTTPDSAVIGAGVGAAGSVTLPSNTTNTVGNISFVPPLSGSYTIAGDSASSKLILFNTPTITVAPNLTPTMTVVLAGTGFIKAGPGQLTLNPGAPYVNSGATIVSEGTLVIGTSSSGRLIIPGDLIVSNSATARLGASDDISDSCTLTLQNGTFLMNSKNETITGLVLDNGTITTAGTETLKVIGNCDVRSGSIGGGTGKLDAGSMVKSTSGLATIAERGSSASGGGITNLTVNDGVLVLDYTQNNSKLNDTGSLTINGGTLVLQNGTHTEAVGSVTLVNGVISNFIATVGLSLATGNYDVRNGDINARLAGAAGLIKSTAGTVTLGRQNSYSGDTRIAAGTLVVGDVAALIGSTLDLNGADSGNLNLGTSFFFDVGGLKGSRNLTLANATNGACTISTGFNGQSNTYSGALSGSGGLITAGGTLTLAGTNSFTGLTQVQIGTLLVDGLLGTNSAPLVQVNGGILGGTGTVCRVAVPAGGTLSPGHSIGTLNIFGALSFFPSSFCLMEVNKDNSTNDRVNAGNAISYDGTLIVTNIGAAPFAAGDSFKLFDTAQGYFGTFGAIDPPTPGPGLAWDTSDLANTGTLKVIAGSGQPVLHFLQFGNTLTLSWDDPGFKLQSQTNPITIGISGNWGDYPGGTFSPVPVTMDFAIGTVFFRLINQ